MEDESIVEEIVFRHKVTVKGKEGVLEISQTSFTFTPIQRSQPRKVFTWANVSNIKYSPFNDPKGRAMILLKTVLQEGETSEGGIMVQLIGDSKEQNFRELERAKGLISNIRRASKASATVAAEGLAEAKLRKSENSDPDGMQRKKRRLLDADKELGRHYKELVQDEKIVTDEEFWAAHESNLLKKMNDPVISDINKNGRRKIGISEMLSPEQYLIGMVDQMRNASGELDITAKQKQEIFMMVPVLKIAFREEVEKEVRSEEDFWYSLFQRVLSSKSSDEHAESSALEDFYIRYGRTEDGMFPGVDMKRRISDKVDDQMDLTVTFGDYRPQERLDLTDLAEKLSRIGSAMAKKYNKFSSYELMGNADNVNGTIAAGGCGKNGKLALGEKKQALSRSFEMVELEKETEPAYIPIKLNTKVPAQTHGTQVEDSTNDATKGILPAIGSAVMSQDIGNISEFVKSTSAGRNRSDSEIALTTIFELDSARLLASDLAACLPSPNRSMSWYDGDRRRLNTQGKGGGDEVDFIGGKAAVSAREDDLQSYLGLDLATTKPRDNEPQKQSYDDENNIPLKLELGQIFKNVGELLSIFYCNLNRAEGKDMMSGSALRERLNGIIRHLTTKYSKDLLQIRSILKSTVSDDASMKQQGEIGLQRHSLGIIHYIETLIKNADNTWSTACSSCSNN